MLRPAHPRRLVFSLGLALVALVLAAPVVRAQKVMEPLGRGVVAVRTGTSSAFVGWRMLGTDPLDVAFNLYRSTDGAAAVKVNADPLTGATSLTDSAADGTRAHAWYVRPVIAGVEQAASAVFTLPANAPTRNYLQVPLQVPAGGTTPDAVAYTYSPNDCSVGDLDGDGEYEIVVKWDPSNAKDNSQSGHTGNVFLDAYTLAGAHLWRIDLGVNIRAGAHYTQFQVYDLDGDGRAEIACRTAEGSRGGNGAFVADPAKFSGTLPAVDHAADRRNSSGYILGGPEFLTIFDGRTGAELASANYYPQKHPDTPFPSTSQIEAVWGDNYGNRMDRFLAAVAYLDGRRPSLVMCRGYYTGRTASLPGRTAIAAWNWRDGQLTQVWTFDTLNSAVNDSYRGEGNHNLSVADVDADGRDEIVYGSCTIDDDGRGLYATGLHHGDALHVSDLDPRRPGLEAWACHEDVAGNGGLGLTMRDARTGAVLFSVPNTTDTGRAVAIDIDPRHAGYECWGSVGGLYSASGTQISASRPSSINFACWWDGDLLREILDSNRIDKWDWNTGTVSRLLTATDCSSNNGSKSNPALSADLLGDWREEVIWRTTDNSALRIFTTTIETPHRLATLMHDPHYRTAVAWQNTAYNQPPHPGSFIGDGMDLTGTRDIVTSLAPAPASASRLANLSVRTVGGSGGDTLILGFVVEGAGSQDVLVRGVGPRLAAFNVAGVMADPTLTLYQRVGNNDEVRGANDDWSSSENAAAIASTSAALYAFSLPNPSKDAALLRALAPSSYTAHITAVDTVAGVALAEVYAVTNTPMIRLVNASARARAGTADQTLIAGFVIDGSAPMLVLVRGVGPRLTDFQVGGVLADPQLSVFKRLPNNASIMVASNSDWATSGLSRQTFARVAAFGLNPAARDAALLVRLSPGQYTAHCAAADGSSGIALIEVYAMPE
jgi:rhamnogalacturonan endolyase